LQPERATKRTGTIYTVKTYTGNDVHATTICLCDLKTRANLDARIYGTNKKDVDENDEDTDVDSQHDRGAAGEET